VCLDIVYKQQRKSKKRYMNNGVFGLRRSYNIIRELALSDFRLKYHDSVLGYFWSLLNPILQFVVLHFVFSYLFVVQVPKFTFYLLSGIVFWNFFYDATLSGMNAVYSKAAISKKVYFPRTIIVFSSTATALISFIINTMILWLVIILFDHFSVNQFLIVIPFLSIILLAIGTAFLLSVFYIYFRDTIQIWLVCLNVGFWLTPIVYNALTAPLQLKMIALFNPLGRILIMLRSFLVYNDYPSVEFIITTLVFCLIFFVIGYWLFNKHSHKIVEYL
jgi:lipopolysaccharide transport system permease protein